MNKTTNLINYYKEEHFRTPLEGEKEIGLWVDRIGSGVGYLPKEKLRILGQYAVVYVESGYGQYVSESGEKKIVGQGDVIICFPNEPSTYYSTQDWKTIWIVWNGIDARKIEKAGYLNIKTPIMHDATGIVEKAYLSLLDIITKEDLASVLERKSILLNMILGLYKNRKEESAQITTYDQINKAIEHLKVNYMKQINIDYISRFFNMSPTHFRRMFKKYSGKTPKELIKTLRISKAKELISLDYPIKIVSEKVGYADIFYFMRVFKEATGVSPGAFKRLQF